MKKIFMIIVCLGLFSCLYPQGITLLYKNNSGWNNPLSWIQINTPVGQLPIQRVPTELDDVVISNSLSGISTIGFVSDNINYDFFVGSNNTSGYRCKSMHISNTDVAFDNPSFVDGAPSIQIYTSNGGFVIIDSGSNVRHGFLVLHGGNPAVTDLKILHSTYGVLFSHASWSSLGWDPGGRAKLVGSTLAGYNIGGYSGGNLYADSCTFETTAFILGDNSTDTLLNSTIKNDGNNVSFNFFIGRNANFVSANVSVEPVEGFNFTSSGSVLNGHVTTSSGYGGGGSYFLQEDPLHPLPNIINGDVRVAEVDAIGISGDLKISGNLSGFSDDYFNNPTQVFVNAQNVFEVAGIANFQGTLSINNCKNNFCHYKLEFFGSTNSNIDWFGGFPIDTLVINKTGCAKVTCSQSLYVSGATKIMRGQLALDPNDTIPYKFVCAGNVDIAQGGGLFLRKDAAGVVANMAIGGTLVDHNIIADSSCAGFSNPYKGSVTLSGGALPITLLDFYGQYQGNAVSLSWTTEKEINAASFTVEKSYDQQLFKPVTTIAASGNVRGSKIYRYTDNTFLKAINYYRLKMADTDGQVKYSKTIAIAAPMNNAITIFPNPVQDYLLIRLPGLSVPTAITITDAKGNCVKRLKVQAGRSDVSVTTLGLPAGVYSITFHAGNLNRTQQFVKH